MKVGDSIGCRDFPCQNVDKTCHVVPYVEVDPERVKLVMISEAAPAEAGDYFYASDEALFAQTTVAAFNDAGAGVASMQEVLDLGVYVTTGIKCGKTGYLVKAASVERCSYILEQEIALFPNVRAFMLMGDVAIKGLNYIAKRNTGRRVIPAGSTYRIRGGDFSYRGAKVFPSYLQAGTAFFIEKSKRRMIAEDLRAALVLL